MEVLGGVEQENMGAAKQEAPPAAPPAGQEEELVEEAVEAGEHPPVRWQAYHATAAHLGL